ncbi:MAG TPA: YceI family protein [Parvibaculum sp.]
MKNHLVASALTALAILSASPALAKEATPPAPAGAYTLDKAHGSLIVRMSHMTFSHFTARFTQFGVKLQIDPRHPEKARLEATIDPHSIDADNPPAGFLDALRGPDWLYASKYPEITYRSTKIERTGPKTARVTGDLTLHGVTHPVVLNATFNGGYPGFEMDPQARIGFSVRGHFSRSAFGISYGVLPPHSIMGVGDDVEVIIEAELTGPAWKKPAK